MKYEKEIDTVAKQYAINPKWIAAIITQESNWEPYALRYEPKYDYFFKPDEIAAKFQITLTTEIQTQKMSWGLGQLMGGVLRQQGHVGPMGEVFEPLININHMGILIHSLMHFSDIDEDVFSMYNAGPVARFKINGQYKNQSYVDSVKKHLESVQ